MRGRERIESDRTYYINVPRATLCFFAFRITLIMFAAYLCSANMLMWGIMTPAYALGIYLYCGFWRICKRHLYRLPPVVLFIVLQNAAALLLAAAIRGYILSLF